MTVSITCPHGYPLLVGQYQGIIHYGHPDGTGCDLLNVFAVRCENILMQFSASGKYVAEAFLSSKEVRLMVYTAMSQANAQALKKMLPQLASWLKMKPEVYGELDSVFGSIIWHNLSQWYVTNGKKPYEKDMSLPSLPMVSIQDAEKTSTLLDIERAVESVRNRTRRY